jgi:hypothetical protein
VDWSLFHALNGALRHQDGGQDAAQIFNAWAIFVLVAVAGVLWFVARPGGSLRPKLAAASAAVAALLAFYRRYGLVLVLGAAAVAIDRIFVGVHYPVDVIGSLVIGLVAAVLVTKVGRPFVEWLVRLLSRLSDPVVDVVWGCVPRVRRS